MLKLARRIAEPSALQSATKRDWKKCRALRLCLGTRRAIFVGWKGFDPCHRAVRRTERSFAPGYHPPAPTCWTSHIFEVSLIPIDHTCDPLE